MQQQATLAVFKKDGIKFDSPNHLKHHYLYKQKFLPKFLPWFSFCADGCCYKFQCCDTSVYKCWPVDIYENSHISNYQALVGNLKCRVDVPYCCCCICCCNCYHQITLPEYVTKSYVPWCLLFLFPCYAKCPVTNEKDEQIGTIALCNLCFCYRKSYVYDRNDSYLYKISKICCQTAGNRVVMNTQNTTLVQFTSNNICWLGQTQTNMPEGTTDEQKLLLLNAVPYLP